MANTENNEKKYAGIETLKAFLAKLYSVFAEVSHTHKLSDIEDYTVDTALSTASVNPVANAAVSSEFESVNQSIETLETALSTKVGAHVDEALNMLIFKI